MSFAIEVSDSDSGFITWLKGQNAETLKNILHERYSETTVKPEVLSSYERGKQGEAKILNLLKQHFDVDSTAKTSRSGDIIASYKGKRILIEVKNHRINVGPAGLEKFDRDISLTGGLNGALLISLDSDITGHDPISITRGEIPKAYLAKPSDDLIISIVKFLSISGIKIANDISLIENSIDLVSRVRKNIDKLKASNSRQLDKLNSNLLIYENTIRQMIAGIV